MYPLVSSPRCQKGSSLTLTVKKLSGNTRDTHTHTVVVQICYKPRTVISTSRTSHCAADFSAACPTIHHSWTSRPSAKASRESVGWPYSTHFSGPPASKIALSKAVWESIFILFTGATVTYSEEFLAVVARGAFRIAKTWVLLQNLWVLVQGRQDHNSIKNGMSFWHGCEPPGTSLQAILGRVSQTSSEYIAFCVFN